MQPRDEYPGELEPLAARTTVRPYADSVVPARAAPGVDPFVVAGIAILVLVALAVLYDAWALRHGGRTISQLLQHLSRWRAWFRIMAAGILAMFGWHVLFGFPWSLRSHGRIPRP